MHQRVDPDQLIAADAVLRAVITGSPFVNRDLRSFSLHSSKYLRGDIPITSEKVL